MFYIPFALCFSDNFTSGILLAFDIIFAITFVLDIFITANTAIKEGEGMITKREELYHRYIIGELFLDIAAAFPLDYILMIFQAPTIYIATMRIVRLIKVFKVMRLARFFKENVDFNIPYFRLVIVGVVLIFLGHLAACIGYKISEIVYLADTAGENFFNSIDSLRIHTLNFIDEAPFTQYAFFFNWIFLLAAYSQVEINTTTLEKIVEVSFLFFFRIYICLISAELSNLITYYQADFSANVARKQLYEDWMNYIRVPWSIRRRVQVYNEYLWQKFKGLDDQKILNNLPTTLRDEILIHLFQDIIEYSEIFPVDQLGFALNVIKKLDIVIFTEGEYIFHRGEIACELYLIIEGRVGILQDDELIAELTKPHYFGEMAIESKQMKPSQRVRSAKALTNLSLATIPLRILNDILEKYPEIYKNIKNKIEEREEQNRAREKAKEKKPDEPSRILKDLDSFMKEADQQHVEGESVSGDPAARRVIDLEASNRAPEEEIKSSKTLKLEKSMPVVLAIQKDKSNPVPDKKSDKKETNATTTKQTKPPQQIGQIRTKKSFIEIDNKFSEPIKMRKSQSPDDLKLEEEEEDKENNAPLKSESLFDESRMNIETLREQEIPNLPIGQVQNPNRISFITMELSRIEPPTSRQGEDKTGRKEYTVVLRNLEESKRLNEDQELGLIENEPENIGNPKLNDSFMASENTFYSQKSIVIPFKDKLGSCCRKLRLKIKLSLLAIFRLYKKVHEPLIYLVLLFNFAWIPVVIGFKGFNTISYNETWCLGAEGFTILIFFIDLIIICDNRKLYKTLIATEGLTFGNNTVVQVEDTSKNWESKVGFYLRVVYRILLMLPFPAVFGLLGLSNANFAYVLLQFIRLTYLNRLYTIVNLKWIQDTIVLKNTVALFYTYALLAHLFACIWIYIGFREADFNNSWLAEIPPYDFNLGVPEPSLDANAATIYLYGFYWALAALTHVGVGDIIPINSRESMFFGFVAVVNCFLFSFFFGIMTRLFEDIARRVVQNYQFARKAVNEYTQSTEFLPFHEKIEQYFSYAWMENRAVNENVILKDLPPTIRVDMQFDRYKAVLLNSDFFKADLEGEANPSLIRSFLKNANYEVFMMDEYIISAGEEVDLIYVLLDGEVQIETPDGQIFKKLQRGAGFGGVILYARQYVHIKATSICKVMFIKKDVYELLTEAYSDWYYQLSKREKAQKKAILSSFEYFKKKANLVFNENTGSPLKNSVSGGKDNLANNEDVEIAAEQLDESFIKYLSQQKPTKIDPEVDENYHSEGSDEDPDYASRREEDLEEEKHHAGQADPKKKDLGLTRKPSINPRFSKFKPGIGVETNFSKKILRKATIEENRAASSYRRQLSRQLSRQPSNSSRGSHKSKKFFRGEKKRQNTWLKGDDTENKKYYFLPNSKWTTFFDCTHLALIVYSTFALAIRVGFDLELQGFLLAMEIIALMENAVYIIVQFRTAQYDRGHKRLKFKILFKIYWERGMWSDLIGSIPFNIIFSYQQNGNVVQTLLKLLRQLQIFRVPVLMDLLESRYKSLIGFFNLFRPIHLLLFLWNTTCCLWIWINISGYDSTSPTYWSTHGMDEKNGFEVYIYAMLWVFTISDETYDYQYNILNNFERIMTIVFIIFSASVTAIVFGIVATSSSVFPHKYELMYNKISKIHTIMSTSRNMPNKVQKKMEMFFRYVSETKNENASMIEALSGILPLNLLKEMIYHQAQSRINFPFLGDNVSKLLIMEIAINLERWIYLPQDYIIYKDDIGEEMFFIIEGTVNVMSPNERQIVAQLKPPSYFGELALLSQSRRTSSCLAATFCYIFVMKKKSLERILERFPLVAQTMKTEGDKRLKELREKRALMEKNDKQEFSPYQVQKNKIELEFSKSPGSKKNTKGNIPDLKKLGNEKSQSKKTAVDPKAALQLVEGLDMKKINMLMDSFEEDDSPYDLEDEEPDPNAKPDPFEEIIEDDELRNLNEDIGKTSLRVKPRRNKRRYSRISFGKQKIISKMAGVNIRWGISME